MLRDNKLFSVTETFVDKDANLKLLQALTAQTKAELEPLLKGTPIQIKNSPEGWYSATLTGPSKNTVYVRKDDHAEKKKLTVQDIQRQDDCRIFLNGYYFNISAADFDFYNFLVKEKSRYSKYFFAPNDYDEDSNHVLYMNKLRGMQPTPNIAEYKKIKGKLTEDKDEGAYYTNHVSMQLFGAAKDIINEARWYLRVVLIEAQRQKKLKDLVDKARFRAKKIPIPEASPTELYQTSMPNLNMPVLFYKATDSPTAFVLIDFAPLVNAPYIGIAYIDATDATEYNLYNVGSMSETTSFIDEGLRAGHLTQSDVVVIAKFIRDNVLKPIRRK